MRREITHDSCKILTQFSSRFDVCLVASAKFFDHGRMVTRIHVIVSHGSLFYFLQKKKHKNLLIMPSCNQRRNQHFMYAFHPGACQARFPGASLFDDEAHHPMWNNKARKAESEQDHTIRMDIPGVKANRVSIEEKDGEIEITAVRVDAEGQVSKIYQEIFYINPFRADVENARATVTNGVLSLTIPKSETSNKTVEVESTCVPSNLPTDIFRHSTDLPGVAASGLKVEIVEDRVNLQGKRAVGDKRILVERSFEVPPSMDPSQARALLEDGVFTFLAPVHSKEGEATLRTILVEDEMEIEPAVADLKISEDDEMNQEKTEDGQDVGVETVNEDAEKDGESWEKIRPEENSN